MIFRVQNKMHDKMSVLLMRGDENGGYEKVDKAKSVCQCSRKKAEGMGTKQARKMLHKRGTEVANPRSPDSRR
jgi:hypothetical protein